MGLLSNGHRAPAAPTADYRRLGGSVALAVVEGVSVLTRLSRDAQGRLRVQAAGTDLSRPLDEAITITGVARWVIRRLWPGRVSS